VRVGENGGEAEAFILAATGKVNELNLPKALIKVGSNDVLKVRNALKLTVNASEGNIHLGAGSILADSNGNITIHDQKDVYVANASDLTYALSSIGTEGVIRLGANMNLTEGLSIDANAGKEFILDLNGKTLDITGGPVGSSGTQTQALHFEKGNVITIKNGTIKASSTDVKMLIQNYADLTLENVTLIHTHDYGYALSNNNGTIVLDGCKINVKEGKVAFDVYNSQYYSDGAKVTVKGNTEINGDIEYGADANYTSDTWVSTLTFEGNNVTVNGELKGDNNTVVKGRWEFALKTQIFGEENVTFNN